MATLEKIRQRKKILAIVIGAALLAFIIEEGVRVLSRAGSTTTVAKVGNEKIEYHPYQQRLEMAAAADQNEGQQTDPEIRRQQVLDEMINEELLKQEFEKVGIEVSSDEISTLMTSDKAAPAVVEFAQQVGAKSPLELYEFISNPGKQGVQESQIAELKNEWNKLTDDIYKQYRTYKLQNLVAGCFQANDLDLAQMAEEQSITNVVTFAKKEYSSLPDDKYPVSDAEIQAEWEKMKPMFKKDEEYRNIHYIAVNILPSQEDIVAAQKIADAAYIALQKGHGIDSVRLLGTVQIDTAKMLQKDLPAKVRDFFANAEVGTTRRDSTVGNHHVMYKLMNKEMSLDSVLMSYVTIQGDRKTQDAVLQQLNAGKTLDELKKAYPQKVDGKLNQWQRAYSAHDTLKAKIANAGDEYVVFNRGDQGAVLMKVNEKKAPKMFYTLATVSYDAYASTKTSEDLRDKFQDFLNKNKTIKDFEENAAKAGYSANELLISPSTAQLGQIKDTRKVIKWAFDSKKGSVSPIFSDNNDVLVAAAVDDIYDQDYLPYSFPQGKEMLTQRVRNSKKGDDLMKQYQGKAKDLQGYATMMGNSIDTANVVFSNGDPKIEPMIVGRISASKPGVLQGPFKGEDAVYVYQVVKQEKAERQPTKEELQRTYAQRRGGQFFGNPRVMTKILSGATKVKKNIIKFF